MGVAREPAGEEFLLSREPFGMRFGLERMRRLLAELGDPQDAFPAVHVVGTNGKSTTTLMIGAALRAQGLRVGCFTSPHLVSFRERIDLNGHAVDADAFAAAVAAVRAAVERLDGAASGDDRVTQFEAVTAVGFEVFRRAGAQAAVVEAGLGGRLDATNVLGRSVVQVLTSVGIDHSEYLGDSVEAIAREKLAVVRSGAALVCGPLGAAASAVANEVSDERDASMTQLRAGDPAFKRLPGGFMRRNAALALDAAETAYGRISPGSVYLRDAAVTAILDFARSERLPGRLQIVNLTPFELRDAAHNEQAARELVAALPELVGPRRVTLLIAMMRDKRIDEVLEVLLGALPDDGAVVCTSAANPRSLPADALAARARALATGDVRVEVESAPAAALGRAREIAGRDGALVVTGSNYLLADLSREPGAPAGATI